MRLYANSMTAREATTSGEPSICGITSGVGLVSWPAASVGVTVVGVMVDGAMATSGRRSRTVRIEGDYTEPGGPDRIRSRSDGRDL